MLINAVTIAQDLPSWRNYYSGNEYKKQYVRLVLVQTGKRGANAQYQIVDAMQMVVIGLIAGAPSMVQIVKVWADEVVMKIAGWKEIPVDTTIGRIMKLVTQGDIVELTGIIHRFRGQVWKRAVRSGHTLRSALSDMWIDVDSTVDLPFPRSGSFPTRLYDTPVCISRVDIQIPLLVHSPAVCSCTPSL